MKEKSKSKILLVILTVIILLSSTSVWAVSESDLNNINQQIKKTESKLDEVETEKSSTLTEISKLNAQISKYEDEISSLEKEIKALESSIKTKDAEIKEKEEIYNENYDKMITRIVASYENGTTTYLDVLLSSKNFSDLSSNWYYLSIITEADKNFLETVQNAKTQIEQTKIQMEKDKEKIEANKKNVKQTSDALKNSQETKKKYIVKLSDEEKVLQDELEQFEKDKKSIQAELAALAEKNNNNNSQYIPGNPSSSGYIFPVAGLSRNNINNKSYPSYPGHTGTDVNINVVGKSVVAVKSGTVAISRAMTGTIPNYGTNGQYVGSYRSYGEYVVIDHHDGTMTLYAHMKAGSRTVSEGQTVKQGQVIGTVGNTGNCLPRPSASSPLNGTHLHFEVRINGSCVNPLPYLP